MSRHIPVDHISASNTPNRKRSSCNFIFRITEQTIAARAAMRMLGMIGCELNKRDLSIGLEATDHLFLSLRMKSPT